MPATIFPATLGFTWGIPTPETGMAVESVRQNDTVEVFEQKNNVGDIVAIVTYNPTAEITIAGETVASFTAAVGTKISVANLIALGGVAAGLVICRAIEFTQAREAMQKISITAKMYPLIPAV